MNHWIAALFLAALPVTASADRSAIVDSAGPRRMGEQLMSFAAADDMTGLFRYMGTISPMERSQLNGYREDIVTQRKPIGQKLGPALGFALVNECRRSDFLVRLIYAEKRAKSAMRWQFVFYRGRDKWQLIYFFWDDKVQEFFEPCT